jgi:uncharacterized membrane protein
MRPGARRLRRYFIVGLVVIAPVGLTLFVLRWVFQTLDSILGNPLRDALGFRVPGLGFLLLAVFVVVVGWIVHRAAGRQLLHWWNEALVRFPLTGRIYNAVSQIVQSVVGERRKLFRRTVLIPYPTEGVWAIAFVTHDDAAVLSQLVGEPCVNVFVPSTPNPTTGFMLIVPRARIIETEISVEEAMKLILSGGAVSPSDIATLTRRRGLDLDSLLRES